MDEKLQKQRDRLQKICDTSPLLRPLVLHVDTFKSDEGLRFSMNLQASFDFDISAYEKLKTDDAIECQIREQLGIVFLDAHRCLSNILNESIDD